MKATRSPGYNHNGFVVTHALGKSCVQVHEFPQSHCSDIRQGILLSLFVSLLHIHMSVFHITLYYIIVILYCISKTLHIYAFIHRFSAFLKRLEQNSFNNFAKSAKKRRESRLWVEVAKESFASILPISTFLT